ncbi:MAG: hypothetical protein OXH57_08440 [Ekhidna sp.]|nr:hypothetical protein [Ekhidna sp.]
MAKGRKRHKIIKAKTRLPFEVNFDFTIGKQEKYKENDRVINIVRKEIPNAIISDKNAEKSQ